MKEYLSNYAQTNGKPTVTFTVNNNGTLLNKQWKGLIAKDVLTHPLHAEQDFENWDVANNETAQETMYEVRGGTQIETSGTMPRAMFGTNGSITQPSSGLRRSV